MGKQRKTLKKMLQACFIFNHAVKTQLAEEKNLPIYARNWLNAFRSMNNVSHCRHALSQAIKP